MKSSKISRALSSVISSSVSVSSSLLSLSSGHCASPAEMVLVLDTTAGVLVDAGEETALEASVNKVPTDSAVCLATLSFILHFFASAQHIRGRTS